jgi:hypothetical protein
MVKPAAPPRVPTPRIDPDKSFFGIALGASEDEALARLGKPDGYLRLNAMTTAMLYGKSMALLFTEGKLSGLRLTGQVIDYPLSQRMSPNPDFDDLRWELANGLHKESTLKDAKRILGPALRSEKDQWLYETDAAVVRLDFSRTSDQGDPDEIQTLRGLTIDRKE